MIVLLCLILLLAFPAYAAESKDPSEDLCIARVENYVNVRKEPSASSDLVGKMYRGCTGRVIGEKETDEGTWYRIRSGRLSGYISSAYLAVGEEAQNLLPEVSYTVAQVVPADVTVYDEPDAESNMIALAYESNFLTVLDQTEDWTQITTPFQITGWVRTDQLRFSEVTSTGETTAQEEERLRQQAEADETAEDEKEKWAVAEEALHAAEPSHMAVMDAMMAQYEAREVFLSAGGTEEEAAAIEHEILDVPEEEESEEQVTEASETETEAPAVEPEYVQTYRRAVEKVLEAQQAMDVEQAKADEKIEEAQEASVIASAAEKVAIEAARKAPRGAAGCEYTTKRDHTIYFPPSLGEELVSYAAQFVGNPYVWGGESLTGGCDCSGFTMLVYARYGISLPHFAQDQAAFGTEITEEDLQPGDLVFFERGNYIYHVAIYIGNDTIIHAASRSAGICFSNLHYSSAHLLFRRLLEQ